MESLKWLSFKQQLQANSALTLQFQYTANQWVNAAYHITEIKQAIITSIDCGGVMNAWTEIIVQLWVPEGDEQDKAMHVGKALSIIGLVEQTLPLNPEGIVKIEFGSTQFDTRQMLPNALVIDGNNLIVDLRPDAVQCKAIDRGGSCGTNDKGAECCTPTVAIKPKIQLQNLAVAASCAPGSGCC
ncbi:DUF6428 family protein [Mucilaginibacter polytrichastri]|nr:DUF6428 family protein [Mucilaginibacter polytrichastri]SFS39256.1 hypothetical protein SAMN04487890_101234 [Mucilaginibacter polytrichastri]